MNLSLTRNLCTLRLFVCRRIIPHLVSNRRAVGPYEMFSCSEVAFRKAAHSDLIENFQKLPAKFAASLS